MRENAGFILRRAFFIPLVVVSFAQARGFSHSMPHPCFEHITLNDGLSHNTVTSIIQDSRGFMWFGTQNGLNKYDGYGIKVYKHEIRSNNSLSSDFILRLYEDSTGKIWIGTYEGGLNILDPLTEKFTRYPHDPENPNSPGDNSIIAIIETDSNLFWLGHRAGLDRFNPRTGKFTHYFHKPGEGGSLIDNSVLSLFEDENGRLWVGTKGGLDCHDPVTGIFTHFIHDADDPKSLSNNFVHVIYRDRSGTLWVGTEGGLNRFHPETGTFTHFTHDPSDPRTISDDIVYSLYEDENGVFWVGTSYGLDILDRESGEFHHFLHNPTVECSIGNNLIKEIYRDRSGLYWFATGNGVDKYDPRKSLFHHVYNDPLDDDSLSGNEVVGICEDGEGFMWIATDTGGLNRYDPRTGRFTRYTHQHGKDRGLPTDWTTTVYVDGGGRVWVGTGAGLCRFGGETETFECFSHDDGDSTTISDNWILAIFEDSNGDLWVGTGAGLNMFDREAGGFAHFRHDPGNPKSMSHDIVRSLYEDRSGEFWVGTDDGLNRLSRETGEFERFRCGRYPVDQRVNIMYEDSSGRFWLGTNIGLAEFDRKEGRFSLYTEDDGLPDNTVNGILEDERGRLWLSTNRGIAVFDPEKETFRAYDAADGLQSNQFNPKACFKSSGGEMYFGGNNGFNRFRPEMLKDNETVPPVVITSIRIFDEEIDPTRYVIQSKELELSHRDNFVSFEFAALDFTSPSKNRYAYRLEGLEKNWHYTGNRRFASYTDLKPGRYLFRVKGSNSDGRWNEEGTSLKIIVHPPFWGTLWFRFLVGLALVGITVGVHFQRANAIRKKKEGLEALVSERTAELKQKTEHLDRERERLFTLLDSLPALVFLQTKDYSIPFANLMARHSFPELKDKPCYETFYGRKEPCPDCPAMRVFATNAPVTHECSPIDGRTYQMSVYPFPDIDGTPLVLKFAIDITARKQAETEKLKSEKMAVMLEMAGAAAHEFNQPIQVLSGYFELIMNSISGEFPHYEKLLKMTAQIERLKSITAKLSKITRYKTMEYIPGKKIIDIDGAAEE